MIGDYRYDVRMQTPEQLVTEFSNIIKVKSVHKPKGEKMHDHFPGKPFEQDILKRWLSRTGYHQLSSTPEHSCVQEVEKFLKLPQSTLPLIISAIWNVTILKSLCSTLLN